MSNTIILGGKIAALGLWILVAANLAVGFPAPYDLVFYWVGGLTAAAHVVECVAFLSVLKKHGSNLALDLVQVMLFGVFHVKSVQATTPAEA